MANNCPPSNTTLSPSFCDLSEVTQVGVIMAVYTATVLGSCYGHAARPALFGWYPGVRIKALLTRTHGILAQCGVSFWLLKAH